MVDRSGGDCEVAIEVVEKTVAVSFGKGGDVETGKVGAPKKVVVLGQVTQEVQLLERGSKPPSAVRQPVVGCCCRI